MFVSGAKELVVSKQESTSGLRSPSPSCMPSPSFNSKDCDTSKASISSTCCTPNASLSMTGFGDNGFTKLASSTPNKTRSRDTPVIPLPKTKWNNKTMAVPTGMESPNVKHEKLKYSPKVKAESYVSRTIQNSTSAEGGSVGSTPSLEETSTSNLCSDSKLSVAKCGSGNSCLGRFPVARLCSPNVHKQKNGLGTHHRTFFPLHWPSGQVESAIEVSTHLLYACLG